MEDCFHMNQSEDRIDGCVQKRYKKSFLKKIVRIKGCPFIKLI